MIISNTGPIIALAGISHLDLLHKLYDRIVIPQAVDIEVRNCGQSSIGLQDYRAAGWIEVQDQGDIDPLLLTA